MNFYNLIIAIFYFILFLSPVFGADCCIVGSGPGCDDVNCEAMICGADEKCCTELWDQKCVNEALGLCRQLVDCKCNCVAPTPTRTRVPTWTRVPTLTPTPTP